MLPLLQKLKLKLKLWQKRPNFDGQKRSIPLMDLVKQA